MLELSTFPCMPIAALRCAQANVELCANSGCALSAHMKYRSKSAKCRQNAQDGYSTGRGPGSGSHFCCDDGARLFRSLASLAREREARSVRGQVGRLLRSLGRGRNTRFTRGKGGRSLHSRERGRVARFCSMRCSRMSNRHRQLYLVLALGSVS